MHWMLCRVAGQPGTSEAVLIRDGQVIAERDVAPARRPGVHERGADTQPMNR